MIILESGKFKGINVYNFSGKIIGQTGCVIFSLDNKNFEGIVVVRKNLLKSKFHVKHKDVQKFSDNGIYLKKNYFPRKLSDDISANILIKAYDQNMNEIGYISEFWFDENTGRVKAVEVAKSIYEDLKYGREIYHEFLFHNNNAILGKKEVKK